jgi:hypothetical protein
MQQNIDGAPPATADHTNKLDVVGTFALLARAGSCLALGVSGSRARHCFGDANAVDIILVNDVAGADGHEARAA